MLRKKYVTVALTALLFFSSNSNAQVDKDKISFSLRVFPAAFIAYEGEGARTTDKLSWESKIKGHDMAYELRLDYKLDKFSGIRLGYFACMPLHEREYHSTGVQSNDVTMKIMNVNLSYVRAIEDSGLNCFAGYQYFQQDFFRSNFKLWPDEYIDFDVNEIISAQGVNFGVSGRYLAPVYFEFELSTGFYLHTKNSLVTDASTLDDKGYGYRIKFETGMDFDDFSAGMGVMRELYHPQVKGGASTDRIVYSYSQNKSDMMGIYLFGQIRY